MRKRKYNRLYKIELIFISKLQKKDRLANMNWNEDMMTCCQDHILKEKYGLKHHIVEMRGGITDAGRRTTISEDRATQPMEAILKAFLLKVNCSY